MGLPCWLLRHSCSLLDNPGGGALAASSAPAPAGADRVSLCSSPGCPGTHFVDQAGLELTEIHPPASACSAGNKKAPLGERHFLLLLSWQGLLPEPPEQRDCWAQRLLKVPPSPPEGTLGESWERQKGRKRRLTISGCRHSPWSGTRTCQRRCEWRPWSFVSQPVRNSPTTTRVLQR